MSIVSYKEYQGSVTYEDGVLLVQVLHVDDLLTAECGSASEVESTFKELIDDYLVTCEELGRKPQKSFKGSFNVRVDPDMHKCAAVAAAEHDLSLNAWVAQAIQEKLTGAQENKRLQLEKTVAAQVQEVHGGVLINWARGNVKIVAKPIVQSRLGGILGSGIYKHPEGDDPKAGTVEDIYSQHLHGPLRYMNPKIPN